MDPTASSAVVDSTAATSVDPSNPNVATNLPPAHVEPVLFFRDVTLGPREAELRFRLVHLWEARNPNTKTLIGQEMLLIDEEVCQNPLALSLFLSMFVFEIRICLLD